MNDQTKSVGRGKQGNSGFLAMNPLLTVTEVAQLLGISEAWVYQHSCGARRPNLPSVKLGRAVRFRLEAVQAFIESMERRS